MRISAEEILPIGSVVLLKGGKKRLMIAGIDQVNPKTDESFDYFGVIYPEGNLGVESTFLFNHEDIVEIDFLGFHDIERQEFIVLLDEAMRKSGEGGETLSKEVE